MTLDFDLDGPPWDFSVTFKGVKYPVRRPTALELCRMTDITNLPTQEAMHKGLTESLAALTGIDLNAVEQIDFEATHKFFVILADLTSKWLASKRKQRQQLPIAGGLVDAIEAADAARKLN
jgi:hypothetical protein